ncbi:MAG: pyridoxal phosphate-dependent decarboxylase family protein [Gemmatimonas sp.]|uniref:pyridoxal phosphate-dependent decarboxylase family protein n=1 Tax=Gemmatimonas sp. TaxID=1962908 RepID=UPI00391F9155
MPERPLTAPAESPRTGDLPADEFRAAAHAAVDWIADYLENAVRYPVRSRVRPDDIREALPTAPPTRGEPLDAMLRDFHATILPGITHWNHPAFFAYFANSGSYPGILGELLAAGLNANGMLWVTSPAVTELEQVTLDWLRQLMGLGDGWFGEITDTASMSTFYALAAARERAGFDVRGRGMAARDDLPRLRVYCSEHAHSSIDKAVIALGLGHENLVRIPADAQFRLRPEALEAAMAADVAAGYAPIAVVPCVGTTSITSIDPVREVVRIARRHHCWVHVDAAYGGVAAIVPELRYLMDGVDGADSFVVNPHKWLFTPMDCSVLYTRDPQSLKQAFALLPEYLVTRMQDEAINLMDYGIQLGRRFRSLKLWMVLRAYGADGLAERIRQHCELAREFAGMVHFEGGWELTAPVTLSLVCFRYVPPGATEAEIAALNAAIMEQVNARGRVYLSHTKLDGRYTLRLAIGNIRTERTHIELAWRELRDAAASVRPAA